MHLINTNAKDCLTPEECNTFVEWIGTVEHIWDSKQQAAVIINNAAKTLGLIYDKEIKGYRSKDIQHPAPEAAVKTVGVTPKTETPTPAAEAKTPVQKAAEFANKAAAKKAETQTAMEVVNV